LQVGFVSRIGIAVALGTLPSQPRFAWAQPVRRAVLAGVLVFLALVLVMRPWRPGTGRIADQATASV
jgi:hypothetical protein